MDARDTPPEMGDDAAHARRTYLPESRPRRRGVALCLSGGGFRAALFHLGALRRLNELHVLSKVDTISCVSGGSILAALLADTIDTWPEPGHAYPHWDSRVAMPVYALVARNLRTGPLARRYLLPWNWLRESVAVDALAESYRKKVTRLRLGELPDRPRFIFSAADLMYGVNWIFRKEAVGDYQAGWSDQPEYPVARAVAASSCFPPFFDPMRVGLKPEQLKRGQAERKARASTDPERCRQLLETRRKLVADLRLSDGGVYDNMGLEPVWKDHEVVLVSDGGGTFDFELDKGPLLRLPRYASVLGRQAAAIRKRWLIASFIKGDLEGTYWGIGSLTQHYHAEAQGYPADLVEDRIAEVRTDMDAFSDGEIAVLENHGYLLADAAIQKHVRERLMPREVPLVVPHQDWMSRERVEAALATSDQVQLLGRWRLADMILGRTPKLRT